MEKETKKSVGRPKKPRPPKEETITGLKTELKRAKEVADNNLEYAKQAHRDLSRISEESNKNRNQIKDVIDTVSFMLDSMENLMRLLRKAIERDLIKDHSLGEKGE